jgi:hypothetical protein
VRLTVLRVVPVISAMSWRETGTLIRTPSSTHRPAWRTKHSTARAMRRSTFSVANSRQRA